MNEIQRKSVQSVHDVVDLSINKKEITILWSFKKEKDSVFGNR